MCCLLILLIGFKFLVWWYSEPQRLFCCSQSCCWAAVCFFLLDAGLLLVFFLLLLSTVLKCCCFSVDLLKCWTFIFWVCSMEAVDQFWSCWIFVAVLASYWCSLILLPMYAYGVAVGVVMVCCIFCCVQESVVISQVGAAYYWSLDIMHCPWCFSAYSVGWCLMLYWDLHIDLHILLCCWAADFFVALLCCWTDGSVCELLLF